MNQRPNLLFIMTDQQRYDALGANGNDVIHTPNLDGLARSGANLQRYYANCPVCVPSRCTLFTGRYPHAHRIRENHNVLEAGREIHLFRALKQAGYRLGYAGKNHLLEREEWANFDCTDVWGFDHDESEQEKALNDYYRTRRARMQASGEPEIWRAGSFHDFPDEATRTYRTGAAGIRFLDEFAGVDPFCLCLSFADPHVPHLAARRFESFYPLEEMRLHPFREGELEEKARRFHIKWRAQKADTADEQGKRRYMAIYYAMITWVDEMVGRVLDKLRALGLEEDTIVVFTSDHGDFCFEHNMCKKDLVLLESLLHVPLLLSCPGQIQPGVVSDMFAEEVDVMPTLLDLMGIKTPFGVQGESFAALLRGEATVHKNAVYGEICPPWLYNRFKDYEAFEAEHGGWAKTPMNVPGDFTKCIRDSDFRYVWYGTGEEELYDLREDPYELHNVAGEPAYADDKTRMKLRLLEWHALTEDPLDPLSIRQIQQDYDRWQPRLAGAGGVGGPGWLEERFTPNPRRL